VKLIIIMSLMTFLSVSCGNPHISSKQPPQQMVSPIMPEDDSDRCGEQTQEQQQQQQQQQQDYVLLKDEDVSKLAKCKGNEVASEKAEGKMNWRFDRPLKIWGTRMPTKSESVLQLFNCREELLKEFVLNGREERIGFSAVNEEVCNVSLSQSN